MTAGPHAPGTFWCKSCEEQKPIAEGRKVFAGWLCNDCDGDGYSDYCDMLEDMGFNPKDVVTRR